MYVSNRKFVSYVLVITANHCRFKKQMREMKNLVLRTQWQGRVDKSPGLTLLPLLLTYLMPHTHTRTLRSVGSALWCSSVRSFRVLVPCAAICEQQRQPECLLLFQFSVLDITNFSFVAFFF